MRYGSPQRQRGVISLFLSLFMLLLITGMVLTAYSMSTTNLRSVQNMQLRKEAISASNLVIDQVVSSPFALGPTAIVDLPVDLNDDSTTDFLVSMPAPTCVRATKAIGTSISSVTLPGMTSSSAYNTVWELRATATDASSGTNVTVVHGARVLLSQAQKNANCP